MDKKRPRKPKYPKPPARSTKSKEGIQQIKTFPSQIARPWAEKSFRNEKSEAVKLAKNQMRIANAPDHVSAAESHRPPALSVPTAKRLLQVEPKENKEEPAVNLEVKFANPNLKKVDDSETSEDSTIKRPVTSYFRRIRNTRDLKPRASLISSSESDSKMKTPKPKKVITGNMVEAFIPPPLKLYHKERKSYWRQFINTVFEGILCCSEEMSEGKEDDLNLDESWMFEPRTANGDEFVETEYQIYLTRKVVEENKPAVQNFIKVVATCMKALDHIRACTVACSEAIKRLEFSDIYQPQGYTDHQNGLIQGRTILGSYIWLLTFALRYVDFNGIEMKWFYTHLSSIVGLSVEGWAAVLHETASAEYIIEDLEILIITNLLSTLGHSYISDTILAKKATEVRKLMDKENTRRFHRQRNRRAKEIAALTNFVDVHKWPKGMPLPQPLLRIVGQFEDDKAWHHLKNLPPIPKINIVKMTLQKIMSIANAFLTCMAKLDKTLLNNPRMDDIDTMQEFCTYNIKERYKHLIDVDSNEDIEFEPHPASSVFESFLDLRTLTEEMEVYPLNLITMGQSDCLHEISHILLDRLDQMTEKFMVLKQLSREAKHIQRVCYEFIRIGYKWPLEPYDDLVPDLQAQFLHTWAHSDDFDANEMDLPLGNPVPLFYASIYQNILKTMPVELLYQVQLKTEYCPTPEFPLQIKFRSSVFDLALDKPIKHMESSSHSPHSSPSRTHLRQSYSYPHHHNRRKVTNTSSLPTLSGPVLLSDDKIKTKINYNETESKVK